MYISDIILGSQLYNKRVNIIMSNDYQLQDVSLWPNVLSLDQNLRKEKARIKQLINKTKVHFFQKNRATLPIEKIIHLLDDSRDIYYPPKINQPSFCKAGLHYSIPDDVVGIGLRLEDPMWEDQSKWAMLYHGTKPQHLLSILQSGLRPGGGQAHKGTKDPWGQTVPNGVYFSFWVNQSFTYTFADNPIIMECFCQDVYVAPGCKGYTVSNNHHLSRILIPLKKTRTEQYI